jgi:hypothetical protein
MKKKIFLIAFLMVFILSAGMVMAGNMNGKPNGNNNWGPVYQPTDVTANYTGLPSDTITICWDSGDDSWPDTTIPAEKWSVVLYATAIFFWNPDCLEFYGCTSCPDTIDVKLEYSTTDDGYFYDPGPPGGIVCLDLSGYMVYEDVMAYLNDELEDCINCQSMDCLYGWTMDPAMTKVKGLAPEKYRRQNNRFSDPVEINNYQAWYDLWVGLD